MIKQKPVLLELIQGGVEDIVEPKLAGGGPKGEDWLRNLGHGAAFIAYPKNTAGVFLCMFTVAFILDECILLMEDMGGPIPKRGWVDSQKFSNVYKLVAVLPAQPDEEAGTNEHHLSGPADSQDNDGHEGSA